MREAYCYCLCYIGALSTLACGPGLGVTSEEEDFNPQKLMSLHVPPDLGLK